MSWQVITIEQAKELEDLGLSETASQSWLRLGENKYELVKEEDFDQGIHFYAYNLSEIAAMLKYSFVPSNVKEAGDKLIEHLKNGLLKAKDANENLKEAKQQSF